MKQINSTQEPQTISELLEQIKTITVNTKEEENPYFGKIELILTSNTTYEIKKKGLEKLEENLGEDKKTVDDTQFPRVLQTLKKVNFFLEEHQEEIKQLELGNNKKIDIKINTGNIQKIEKNIKLIEQIIKKYNELINNSTTITYGVLEQIKNGKILPNFIKIKDDIHGKINIQTSIINKNLEQSKPSLWWCLLIIPTPWCIYKRIKMNLKQVKIRKIEQEFKDEITNKCEEFNNDKTISNQHQRSQIATNSPNHSTFPTMMVNNEETSSSTTHQQATFTTSCYSIGN